VLEELHISEFALIDEALIEFAPGLNVLTGETGAGKTILVAALGLLLGGRSDTTAIRAGSNEARVEGRFRLPERGEMIISRVISAGGKSKCYLDGSLASVGALAEFGESLVDLHGQHEHQALLRPASHVDYLDRFCGAKQMARRQKWLQLLGSFRETEEKLAQSERISREWAERRELSEFQLLEIEEAELSVGEDEELAVRLEVLRHAQKLALAAAQGRRCLTSEDEETGAVEGLRRGAAALAAVSGIDPDLDRLRERADSAAFELEDLAHALREYGEAVEFSPEALAEAEARMALISDLKRKHGSTIAEVLQSAARLSEELRGLDSAQHDREHSQTELERLEGELKELGAALHACRAKAASQFESRMTAELSALNMSNARFAVSLAERDRSTEAWGTSGTDSVEFLFSSNVGEAPRPLAKIASGGEISRVMLAAKVVLGAADDVPTLVFDEIDAGVGGKTAASVGAKLAALASDHQVICVTHLAPIAAVATRHLSVAKSEESGRSITSVTPVDGERRVEEVARMLSGSTLSETSLKHAREMLAGS